MFFTAIGVNLVVTGFGVFEIYNQMYSTSPVPKTLHTIPVFGSIGFSVDVLDPWSLIVVIPLAALLISIIRTYQIKRQINSKPEIMC